MSRALIVSLLLAISTVGCSGTSTSKSPTPTEPAEPAPTPTEPAPVEPAQPSEPAPVDSAPPLSQDDCKATGGRVSLSRGDNQPGCTDGETQVGRVRFGIEGGWCCKAKAKAP